MNNMLKDIREKYPNNFIDIRENNQMYIDNGYKLNVTWQPNLLSNISAFMRKQVNDAMFTYICQEIDNYIKNKKEIK